MHSASFDPLQVREQQAGLLRRSWSDSGDIFNDGESRAAFSEVQGNSSGMKDHPDRTIDDLAKHRLQAPSVNLVFYGCKVGSLDDLKGDWHGRHCGLRSAGKKVIDEARIDPLVFATWFQRTYAACVGQPLLRALPGKVAFDDKILLSEVREVLFRIVTAAQADQAAFLKFQMPRMHGAETSAAQQRLIQSTQRVLALVALGNSEWRFQSFGLFRPECMEQ